MSDRVIDLLKTKDFVVPYNLFLNYKKLGLQDFEFIVLVYLINQKDHLFDPMKMAIFFNMEIHNILEIISNLQSKSIIQIDYKIENNIRIEFLNIDNLYRKLSLILMEVEEEKDTSIFGYFENEYGRLLSPTEIKLINNWLEAGYKEDMIKNALNEAVFNGVTSLKYIDKILFNWSQNGVSNNIDLKKKAPKKELFEYDWLNE